MRKFTLSTLLLTVGLSIACGSNQTEANRTGNFASGGQSAENPVGNSVSNSNKTVEKNETPKPEKTADLPKFEKQEDYKTKVREKLFKSGWLPARSEEGDSNCNGQTSLCQEFPELEAGPSSPLGQAVMRWKKGGKILLVSTIDSFLFDGYQYERTAKPTPTAANIEGKYVYSYKHDSGEDTFIWELKKGKIATYVSEREGGDGADLKGTWEFDEAENTVTVNFSNAPDGAETYVFTRQGNSLKMIKEPRLPQGVNGFTGTIYKKQ